MTQKPPLHSTAFPDAGIYVMRSERIYMVATCQPIGMNGVGAHKHNDWLSFELCVDEQPVIIDPGTYCYTGNMEMRRLFRSTKYHNTVVVDGKEQVEIHNSMFGLINPHGDVKVLRWESDHCRDLLEAEHTGYTRLAEPLTHRRRFLLDKIKHNVEITDTFIGNGEHLFEWYLHLDVGLYSKNQDHKVSILKDQKFVMSIELQGFKSMPTEKPGWVSRSYNRRENCKVVYLKKSTKTSSNDSFTQHISVDKNIYDDDKE